jgi:hypothetical protein
MKKGDDPKLRLVSYIFLDIEREECITVIRTMTSQ